MSSASATLADGHLEHLLGSAIDPDIIEERGYRTITSQVELGELEPRLSKSQRRAPTLLIPAYGPLEREPYAFVSRPDQPRERSGKSIKYEFPMGVSPCLDVLPRFHSRLADPNTPLLITEGAKKADAAASLDGYVVININGVFGWRGKSRAGGAVALADWEHVALPGRVVILAFDSDWAVNKQVRQALNRLAAFLASKGASVHHIILPAGADGQKNGLDDWLASLPQGDRLRLFEQAIVPYETARGITKAGTHPQTLEELFHPEGYHLQGNQLVYTDPKTDAVRTVYPGVIGVTALGCDLETGQETATVRFKVRGETRSVTAARHELAQGRTLIPLLTSKGAAVHDQNARQLSAYLTEYASLNDEALPYTPHTSRLGLMAGGLVTPAGSVGTNARYQGPYSPAAEGDESAYERALAAVLEWESPAAFSGSVLTSAWPLWFTLGAALASPIVARLGLRRSPVLYLSGPSGSGKTTTAMFANGVWGNPERPPFKIETPRTTSAGFMQAVKGLGGLPVLIDEVHTHPHPSEMEAFVYAFANGQAYTKGSVEGAARGGEALQGTVILAGEAVVEFAHAGSQRRVLHLPSGEHPPLGCPPGSAEGRKRARLLEDAWKAGAGTLGPRLVQRIWEKWPEFKATVTKLERAYDDRADRERGVPHLDTWGPAIAAIVATLYELFSMLSLSPLPYLNDLDLKVARTLEAAQAKYDPARVTFENVRALIAVSTIDERGVGRLGDEITCWRDSSGGAWYVPTDGGHYLERVGKAAVQQHGRAWVRARWIEPDSQGKSTRTARPPGGGGSTRCLKVLWRDEGNLT